MVPCSKPVPWPTSRGFSLLELVIVFSIIGILVALAMYYYADYTLRARISGGLRLAAPVKAAVGEYYARHETLPVSNNAAGVLAPGEYADRDVKSISIAAVPASGTIVIAYKARGSVAEGDSLLLIPSGHDGSITWQCVSRTLVGKLLPAACRN
jgi:prepilin-type N-terminal cleavage/methylation domain-containing protein